MLSVLLFAFAFAGETNCNQIANYKDFYQCSLKRHPLSEVANLKTLEGEAFIEQAGQWQNPDLDVKSVAGSKAGEQVGSTELSVAVPVSQLWKKGARMSLAEAEKKRSDLDAKGTLLDVKKSLIKDLYRLGQINHEMELVDETLSAFGTIQRQFRSRKARGPEQEVTLNLVELATSDYELKKNRLVTERLEIVSRFKGIWGADFEVKPELLPARKAKWPTVTLNSGAGQSLEVQRVVADAEAAAAEKKAVDRESWPEVRIGPAVERTTEGPTQYYSYGVTASVTLPILTWNGGSRKLADVRARQARFVADYTQQKSNLESEIHLKQYNAAVASLKAAFGKDELNRKHQRVENLARQGLLAGNLVIEAHRQLFEYTVSQHEHENNAIESFIELQTLRGEDFEEILK